MKYTDIVRTIPRKSSGLVYETATDCNGQGVGGIVRMNRLVDMEQETGDALELILGCTTVASDLLFNLERGQLNDR